jgi:hypothetical protein
MGTFLIEAVAHSFLINEFMAYFESHTFSFDASQSAYFHALSGKSPVFPCFDLSKKPVKKSKRGLNLADAADL